MDVTASWVVSAAHTSAFRGGRRDPSHLSVHEGRLRLHRRNADPGDLFPLADVTSGGWAHPYEGPLAWGEPHPLGIVWFLTKDELFVFPLADWWSNGVECPPPDALRSSGFLELFEMHGLSPRFDVQPAGRFAECAGEARVIRSIDLAPHRRLATLQASLSLCSAAAYVAVLILAVTSFLSVSGELPPALIATGAATVVLVTSILNLWSVAPWLRPVHMTSDERGYSAPKSSRAPASDRLRLTWGPHGMTVSDASGTSVVIRSDADAARPGTMRFHDVVRGGDRDLVLTDDHGLPRARLPLSDWAPTPGDEQQLREWLLDQGLDASPDRLRGVPVSPPIGLELARTSARQALLGGGPWRTPSPLMALRPSIASGVLLVPFVVTLTDGGPWDTAIHLSSIAVWVLSTSLIIGLPAWWMVRLWFRVPLALRRDEW